MSFLLLAATGLVILYGGSLIRPWLGAHLYADLARVSAWSHMTFAVPFVLVQKNKDEYERRPVKVGNDIEGGVEILEGVGPGDRVVTTGSILLKRSVK